VGLLDVMTTPLLPVDLVKVVKVVLPLKVDTLLLVGVPVLLLFEFVVSLGFTSSLAHVIRHRALCLGWMYEAFEECQNHNDVPTKFKRKQIRWKREYMETQGVHTLLLEQDRSKRGLTALRSPPGLIPKLGLGVLY